MKNLLRWAGAMALVLLASPAFAQTARTTAAPAGFAPILAPCVQQADGSCLPISTANPLPITGGGDPASQQATAQAAGSPADAAWTSGNGSLVALLKSIASSNTGPLPAGTANIGNVGGFQTAGAAATGGGFRIQGADSGGLARDLRTDTTGNLTVKVSGSTAVGSAASDLPVRVGVTDTNGTLQSLKATTLGNVQVREGERLSAPQESTTALAAGATYTGGWRDAGAATNGAAGQWSTFGCQARSDVAGTLYVDYSSDQTTAYTFNSVTVAAGVTVQLKSDIYTRYYRCRFINGATAQASFDLRARLGAN